jgi:hypothetical protein
VVIHQSIKIILELVLLFRQINSESGLPNGSHFVEQIDIDIDKTLPDSSALNPTRLPGRFIRAISVRLLKMEVSREKTGFDALVC